MSEPSAHHFDRRRFLRRAAIGAGAAWATPVILTLTASPAFATPPPVTWTLPATPATGAGTGPATIECDGNGGYQVRLGGGPVHPAGSRIAFVDMRSLTRRTGSRAFLQGA